MKNTLIALGIAVVILGAVLYGMIPGFVKVASWFELFFVNTCGLSFNSGVIIYLIATVIVLIWAVYETQTVKNEIRARIAFIVALTMLGVPFVGSGVVLGILVIAALSVLLFVKKEWNYRWLNTIVLCAMVMLIGYSSYSMIVIRSLANTPMDQNSPEDVFSLQSYLNLEQYGDRPLFYGAMYSAPEILDIQGNICVPRATYGNTIWQQKVKTTEEEKDSYENLGKRQTGYEMDPRFNMLFPRMYSSQSHHVSAYKSWGKIKGKRISVNRCGNKETLVMPTMGENLRFFFSYQVNFMYWRYFMWNFAGRQNDMQGHGELDKGNWISGIPFIDNVRLGDQRTLPDSLKNNKGRNRYFMLPLLLGVLGIAWQLCNKKEGNLQFWIVFTLFFMTGIAIVMYLNQTPYQPRERDYAYAGSFYAFSIWIGLGVMFLYSLTKKIMPKPLAAIIVTLLGLGVPALMAQQNWDDHNRSNRRVARDFGLNYLNSCEKNAIIFSNGDNDTFPLWYNQEVEENRTDMRVCNLSYLNTDWYIDQMRREAYSSAPLPISWDKKDYAAGHLEACRVDDHPQFANGMELGQALDLVRDPKIIDKNGIGRFFSSTLILPVDKEQVLKTGTVEDKDADKIAEQINIKLKRTVGKAQLMILEMLNTNNWERPIYVAATVGSEYYPALQEYMQLEGLAYRIVPVKGKVERVNTEKMYDNMMNKFVWGNMADPNVYLDEQHIRMARTMRMMFAQLAEALIDEEDNERAEKVLNKCLEVIPTKTVPADYSIAMIAGYYYELGQIEKADNLVRPILDDCIARIEWANSLKPSFRKALSHDMSIRQNVGLIQNLWMSARNYNSGLTTELEENLQKYYPLATN